MTDFEKALPLFLKYEGGFVNDPDDPGGATNKGVTQLTYNTYRKRKGLPRQSVRYIAMSEVSDIYKSMYWDVVGGDGLEWPLNLIVADAAINCGPSRANKWLAAASGTLKEKLVSVIKSRREHYKNIITANPRLSKFKRGWENRVKDLEKEAGL